jgi:hypothetical protein
MNNQKSKDTSPPKNLHIYNNIYDIYNKKNYIVNHSTFLSFLEELQQQ